MPSDWSLEREALLPEWSTWLLICTCVSTWVGPGVSIHGEGGGNPRLGSKHRYVFRASGCTVVLPPEEGLVPPDNFTITFHH
ncbi:hypothetical protein VULLAG_LOCUS17370 [Vulpes lagopus]